MDSIKKVTIGEIKENKEELLNSMKGLVHTAKDIFGSTPFKDEYIAVGSDHIITIEVGGNIYPVHYTPNTMAMLDGDLSITDDIYDGENYLSLSDDDDMMWFSLAMQLDLKNKSNELSIEYLENEIERLKRERSDFKEALKEANKQLSDPDTITSQAKMEDAYTKRTIDLLGKITELENDNKRLSERVKTLVIEKSKLEKSDDDRIEKPASEIIKECVGDSSDLTEKLDAVKMDLETALMQQQIAQLNTRIAQLEEKLKSTEVELTTAMNTNGILKTKIAALADEKREAELLAYRLTRGEMHVQFDSMKSLEHENGVLKNENADLNQKLCQKVMHATYSAHGEEPEDELRKKYDEVLDYNKKLRQEITALRIEAGKSVADSVLDSNAAEDNEGMQQTIAKETMADLTAKINELEAKLKDKDECINQLRKNNNALSAENKNISEMIKNADRDARFYAREVDHLRQENDKIYSILNDAAKVVRERNKQE